MRILSFIYLFLAVVSGPIHPLEARAESPTVTLAADSWFPFNGDPTSDKPGYMVEIARRVFGDQGLSVDYRVMPWTRSIQLVESGAIDGIIAAGRGETPSFIFPHEPLAISHYTIFTLEGNSWRFTGAKSLEQIKLGVISDYSYADTIDNHVAKFKGDKSKIFFTSGESALEQAIEMLVRGRVDGVVSNPEVFKVTIQSLGKTEKIKPAATMPESDPLYIAFSPNKESSKRYAEILSNGIIRLRSNGELQKILDRYGLTDWID